MIPNDKMQASDALWKRNLSIRIEPNLKPEIVLLDDDHEENAQEENSPHENALLKAAAEGNFRILQSLVVQGVKRECTDEHNNTPLMLAAAGGHDKVVRYLIYRHASLIAENEDGWTALEMAVANGENEYEFECSALDGSDDHPEMVAVLMDALWINKNAWEEYTEKGVWGSAISIAAKRGNDKALEMLMKCLSNYCKTLPNLDARLAFAKQYLHACDEDGNTPLMLAAGSPHVKKGVQLLIEAGASYKEVNKKNQDALYSAAASGTTEIVAYLLETMRKDSEYFKSYCIDGRLAKALSAAVVACDFCNHNTSDEISYQKISLMFTALSLTVGDSQARTCLLDYRQADGNTLLHLAASCGKYQTVIHLFYLGLPVDVPNDAGMTALEKAQAVPIKESEPEAFNTQQNIIAFLQTSPDLQDLRTYLQLFAPQDA